MFPTEIMQRKTLSEIFCSALLLSALTNAQNASTKRGLAYQPTNYPHDYSILLSSRSPISWYYNWAPSPPGYLPGSRVSKDEFVPLVHGIDNLDSDVATVKSLPSSTTHLLTFNEPDGSTSGGGSNISPQDAAQAYIDSIVPLRHSSSSPSGRFQISHPSTTGSAPGLDWLRAFNESCYDIDPQNGCPTDFIAAHWYGGFGGLASWLGQLDEWYNTNTTRNFSAPGTPGSQGGRLKIWITEMALPQADVPTTLAMMNQSLPYLDQLDYVERYAWFGAFRADAANEWTGDSVALWDSNGALTQLGATYLGGQANGFEAGQTRGASSNDGAGGGGGDMMNLCCRNGQCAGVWRLVLVGVAVALSAGWI